MVGETRIGNAPTDLVAAVRRRFELGRAAWPGVTLPLGLFERYFAARATLPGLPKEAHAGDMYLACSCAHGVDGALTRLEPTLLGDVARAVASIDASNAFVDEVLQATRERLLVRKGHEPAKIGDYAGRASLKNWLCAVAVRCAISQRRRLEPTREPSVRPDDRQLAKGGPEFDYLRGRYKHLFEDAVRGAIEQLAVRDRMLLRLNLVNGMSVDKLGTMYGVGRSTAARWLADARRALLKQAHCELRTRLRITSTELYSLGMDLRSQLEVSIFALLAR